MFFWNSLAFSLSQQHDLELTVAQTMNSIAQFRLKLKKVEKTTRPFRYDLNQVPL